MILMHIKLRHVGLSLRSWLPATMIILLVTMLISRPLFLGTLGGHDVDDHYLWAHQFIKTFESGIWHPRWLLDTNLGLGSPTFVFYPPLSYWVMMALYFLFDNIVSAINLSMGLSLFLSGITMYLFCRQLFSNVIAAMCAVMYLIVPYHLIDIYIRMAVSESWAFVWPPLIFYFIYRLPKNRALNGAGLAMSFALLILTHLATALIFSCLLGILCLLLLFQRRSRISVKYVPISLLAGLGISAFYLVPAILEQQYVRLHNFAGIGGGGWFDLENNFLFSSKAGDLPFNGELSWLATTMTILVLGCSYFVLLRKHSRLTIVEHSKVNIYLFHAGTVIICFALMLPYCKIAWQIIPKISQIQFPWRLLIVTSFSMIVCLGFAFTVITSKFNKHLFRQKYSYGIAVLIFIFMLMTTMFNPIYSKALYQIIITPFAPHKYLLAPNQQLHASDSPSDLVEFSKQYHFRGKRLSLADSDYLPKTALRVRRGWTYIGKIPERLRNSKVIWVDSPDRPISIDRWEPQVRVFEVDPHKSGTMLVYTSYYPGWQAYAQGKELTTTVNNKLGLIMIDVPSGTNKITLVFEDNIWKRIGKWITLLSIIIGGVVLLRFRESKISLN